MQAMGMSWPCRTNRSVSLRRSACPAHTSYVASGSARTSRRSSEDQAGLATFLGSSANLIRNIHGVGPVAELDGDEIGYLVSKVAEIKRRR